MFGKLFEACRSAFRVSSIYRAKRCMKYGSVNADFMLIAISHAALAVTLNYVKSELQQKVIINRKEQGRNNMNHSNNASPLGRSKQEESNTGDLIPVEPGTHVSTNGRSSNTWPGRHTSSGTAWSASAVGLILEGPGTDLTSAVSGCGVRGWTLSGSQQRKGCFTAAHNLLKISRTALFSRPLAGFTKMNNNELQTIRNISDYRSETDSVFNKFLKMRLILSDINGFKELVVSCISTGLQTNTREQFYRWRRQHLIQ